MEARQRQQTLMVIGLVMVMATDIEMMVTVTTWKAAAALTHRESKVCSCLQRVNPCAHTKNRRKTHQCHQDHPSNGQNVCTASSDGNVDVDESNSYLQKSNQHERMKRLTWDMEMPHGHLKTT